MTNTVRDLAESAEKISGIPYLKPATKAKVLELIAANMVRLLGNP